MADGHVQVPVDGAGKKIDANEITRGDAVLVERQRMEVPDQIKLENLLQQMLVELRLNNFLLSVSFNITDDLNGLRGQIGDS